MPPSAPPPRCPPGCCGPTARRRRPVGAASAADAAGSGNLLIQGDNLDALAALLPFYRGRVKCIFIDPPYNTKSAS